MHKRVYLCLFLAVVVVLMGGTVCAQPQNVIIFIGDGMGPQQILAGRLYSGEPLSFETMPYQGKVTTHSADSAITDSAAAGTAIATGQKVNNGVISQAFPGDGSALETILERLQAAGKSTGLITTAYMTHATPATFGAHESSRSNYEAIRTDYLTETKPDLLLGGGFYMQNADVEAAGYTLVRTRAGLNALPGDAVTRVSGQFGLTDDGVPYESNTAAFSDLPHLSEMTAKALEILDNDPDGFFLMVEGGKIDWACHVGDIENTVLEVVEFAQAVQVARTWAQNRTDTLILVTADHETGGLTVTGDNGAGALPTVTWATGGHTATMVDLFAEGPNSQHVYGTIDNTDITGIITSNPVKAYDPWPVAGAEAQGLDVLLSWSAGLGAVSYDLYWGTDADSVANAPIYSPAFVGNLTTTGWDPGPLEPGMTYYWRVDVRDTAGGLAAASRVWDFTTMGVLPVGAGERWRFDDTATDLDAAWRLPDYDDSAWRAGPAPLGYGDGDEATLLQPGLTVDRTPCYYFRHAFWADATVAYPPLELGLVRDDGAVVYLNGYEIARSNMPAGEVSFTTLASTVVGSTDESAWYRFDVDPTLLSAGKNVIAVEIHQGDPQSSDISFDLSLQPAVDDIPMVPTGLSATAGDGWVQLDWSDNVEPEGDLAGYQVYRRTESADFAPLAWATDSALYDATTQNGATYCYAVGAIDQVGQESPLSIEICVTPEAPSQDAYVLSDPVVSLGSLTGGGYTGLATANDGQVQTLAEGPDGKAGASSLLAEYQLYTPANPAEIVSLRLVASLLWDDADTNDALQVAAYHWDTGSWSDITGVLLNGDWIPASPAGYVDAAGLMVIRFRDSGAVRKESKGTLTIDQLYAEVATGVPEEDTTPPVIRDVTIGAVTYNAASVNVSTDEMTTILVEYRIVGDTGVQTADSTTLAMDHSIPLAGLAPDTPYALQVFCTDFSGNKSASDILNFSTAMEPEQKSLYVSALNMTLVFEGRKAGGLVQATVYDARGDVPVSGATITGDWLFRESPLLAGATAVTDSNGQAVFESPTRNVKPGDVFRFTVTNVTLPGYSYDANNSIGECTATVP